MTFWAAPPFKFAGSSSVPSSRCNAVDKSARWVLVSFMGSSIGSGRHLPPRPKPRCCALRCGVRTFMRARTQLCKRGPFNSLMASKVIVAS
jgi:hypothetical protein